MKKFVAFDLHVQPTSEIIDINEGSTITFNNIYDAELLKKTDNINEHKNSTGYVRRSVLSNVAGLRFFDGFLLAQI